MPRLHDRVSAAGLCPAFIRLFKSVGFIHEEIEGSNKRKKPDAIARSKELHDEVLARLLKLNQERAETKILQLLRTPMYLAGIFLFSFLASVLGNNGDVEMLKKGLTFFSTISLLIFSIDRLGKRIAIERV